MAGVPGTIHEVYLRNFLCHSELRVTFSANITFLTGKNGSGKSAVLTAITVALGQRATTTSRGSSYNDLIKTGEDRALVRVTINNKGVGSFKHNIFGNVIVVERCFVRSGAASYKIMNANGGIVSKKKEDLTRILTKFNIQVDNPVCILNQETAKNFLFQADAKLKYELFERAAQLDVMTQELNKAISDLAHSKSCLQNKIQDFNRLKMELESWRKKMHIINGLNEQRERILSLQTELAWAYVKSLEEDAQNEENALAELRENHRKVSEELREAEQRETEIQEQIQVLDQRKGEWHSKIDDKNKEMDTLAKERDSAIARLRTVIQEIKEHATNKRRLEADKRELEAIIENLQARDPLRDEMQKQEQLRRISLLESEQEELARRAAAQTDTLEAKRSLSEELRSKLTILQNALNALKSIVRETVREIEQLKSSQKDQLAVYGQEISQLVRRFDSAGFRRRPKGPFGAYIKLHDTTWGPAVEACLGRYLRAFLVDSDEDARILQQLCSGMHFRPNIVTQRMTGRMHPVHDRRVTCDESLNRAGVHTFLDMITFDDADVANCLIDWLNIETLLLINDPDTAENLLAYAERVPLNCSKAFIKTGATMFPDPNYRSYPLRLRASRYLQVSVQERIQRLTEELRRKELEVKSKEAELLKIREELGSVTADVKTAQTDLLDIRKRQNEIKQELEQLRTVDEPQSSDIPVYQEDLLDVTSRLEAVQTKMNSSLEERERLKQILEENKSHLERIRTEKNAVVAEYQKLVEAKEGYTDKLKDLTEGNKRKSTREEKLAKLLSDKEKEVEEMNTKLAEESRKAERFGTRLETGRNVDEISREMDALSNEIDVHERLHGSRAVIEREFLRLKNQSERANREIENNELTNSKLSAMRDRRVRFLHKFRESVEQRVHYGFQGLLAFANFEGRIKISREKKTLEMIVRPADMDDKQPPVKKSRKTDSNLRGLSGGERSFTTVCFILSLWDAIESPFRMLDEFDVFMVSY